MQEPSLPWLFLALGRGGGGVLDGVSYDFLVRIYWVGWVDKVWLIQFACFYLLVRVY